MAKKKASSWLAALQQSGMQVKSARDALQLKGLLDTGNYALNWAISGKLLGGYPLGHTMEFFGDPGTGKSFLAARALAMAQIAGGVALLDDIEGAYVVDNTIRMGVDVDAMGVPLRSLTVKQHIKAVLQFIEAYKGMGAIGPGVLVADSHAQLSTEHELETMLDKRDMSKAAEMKAFYRIVGGKLFDETVCYIATNHKIAAIGNMFQQSTTPGGGGAKFISTVRLDLRAISKIKLGEEVTGVICTAYVAKNRIFPPFKKVQLAIPFTQPISRASGLLPLLVSLGVLEERGQFLFKDGQKLGRAYKTKDRLLAQDEQAETILDQYPELLEEVDSRIETGRTATPQNGDTTDEEFSADETNEE